MLYLVIISPTFRKSALNELARKAKFRIVDELTNFLIIDTKEKGLQLKMRNSIFSNGAFRLSRPKPILKSRYLRTITSAFWSLRLPKTRRLKLECVDINSKSVYSAKDIEVKAGQPLEDKGYNINLNDPELIGYVVLMNGKCYSGIAECEAIGRKFINPLRHYHTEKKVSRSELKLRQAFDEFKIAANGGIAIDLGAAPGGWSLFLASMGFKVIAIDNAALNYDAIRKAGMRVKVISPSEGKIDAEKELRSTDLIHIKSTFDEAARKLKTAKASLLTDDMNLWHKDSANAIIMYSRFMGPRCMVILTVKCVTRNVDKYLDDINMSFRGRFSTRAKVLPSNRQEVTVFAYPKAGTSKIGKSKAPRRQITVT
ncbi:MAG: SAM-dependent methyltransferase [Candidatus Micrarchaeota archaeon]|nr:SAM-dependent methyltransferase [Candidatus Micrarchaeota archaeon]